MTATRSRPLSIDGSAESAKKRIKLDNTSQAAESSETHFFAGLFEESNVARLHDEYSKSGPYNHAVVEKLFQEDLVVKVKDECIGELSFTEKETDIYKVQQTGDLASLNYLAEEEVARLQSLLKFRNALYSPAFRAFVRKVTGCGPLSGKQQDMSVNSYKKGCHLLNHDDVIGSRRVSYIFYMPLPHSEEWKREWGGSLELYPVKLGANGVKEPECTPSKIIPPSWNQFVFFEVQPGHSFHSVEEVVVDEGDNERQRLSISGWFHKAHEDEEDYVAEPAPESKSSLEQLSTAAMTFTPYDDDESTLPNPDEDITPNHLDALRGFLNPVYLDYKTLRQLDKQFVDESSLELRDFLDEPIANALKTALPLRDAEDGLDGGDSRKGGALSAHSSGISSKNWTLYGPPHKARYCILPEGDDAGNALNSPKQITADTPPEQILRLLQSHLFPSAAFRAWLSFVCSVVPLGHHVEARRFRPGFDYTLATGDENDAHLDVVLGLTPEVVPEKKEQETPAVVSNGKGKGKATEEAEEDVEETEEEPQGWEAGEWGGWECYMAPHEGEDDPAVYRSGSSGSKNGEKSKEEGSHKDGDDKTQANGANGEDEVMEDGKNSDGEGDSDDEDEGGEEDGTLLTVQPGFNRLLLVLRDPGVLRFVKYVSASAPGSRWDVCAEYEIGALENEDEEGEEVGIPQENGDTS